MITTGGEEDVKIQKKLLYGINKCSHTKQLIWSPLSYHTQKLTQSAS